jgi:hypothetical protein
MTVQRLIEKLQGIKDKSQEVEVSIGQYNKKYPVAYCPIYDDGFSGLQSNGKAHRIQIDLPSEGDSFKILSTCKK